MTVKELKEISRESQMLHKVVMVNGFPGCGKTMLSPIISAYPKVELMQYAPLIEQVCELYKLQRIQTDVAESMIKMNADLLIYESMMGRNANCRPSDLSSIFKFDPLKHIGRMLRKGDELIPDLILQQQPILNLTTHMLLPALDLLNNSLKDKLTFIEVVRHPLYMIIQHEMNLSKVSDPRFQHICYKLGGKEYTFYSEGWEDLFKSSNSFERAIYSMNWYFEELLSQKTHNCLVIPFELFVKSPDLYIKEITESLSSSLDRRVKREMANQKVPRDRLSDGPALDIYKKCGWVPPQSYSEEKELEIRRELVKANVSKEALDTLDAMCASYEKRFLSE